jgi:hypothetical protein
VASETRAAPPLRVEATWETISPDPELRWIYAEKIPPKFWQGLVDERLAMVGSNTEAEGALVGMHPKLAAVYMTALAEHLAGTSMQPITDETQDYVAVSGWTLERLTQALPGDVVLAPQQPSHDETVAELATIALRAVMPRDIGRVPVDIILKLRERNRKGMSRFQQHIHDLVDEMPQKIQDMHCPEVVSEYLAVKYETQVKPEMQELEENLKSLEIDTVWSALGVKVMLPPAAESLAHVLHIPPADPIVHPVLAGVVAAGALAYSIVPAIRSKRAEARREEAGSPVGYLLRVEEELQPKALTSWIGQRIRQFILGV